MKLTIPIRARKSTVSWGRKHNGHSFVRTRVVVTFVLVTVLVGSLLTASIGSVTSTVEARSRHDNNRQRNWSDDRRSEAKKDHSNRSEGFSGSGTTSGRNDQGGGTRQKSAPAQPAPPTPQAPSAPITPRITPAASAPTPPPVDTAPGAAQLTAAQATSIGVAEVTYSTQRISTELRDRLLILAGIAGITGALLYTLSTLIAVASVPVRRVIPVQYVTTRGEVSAT